MTESKISPVRRFTRKLRPRKVRTLGRVALAKAYGFSLWHRSLLSERPYAQRLLAHLNARDAESRGAFVEIGCGLGDIIRHARYDYRLGLDRDPNILRAARLLARLSRERRIDFREFVFPESQLDGQWDAIVMVNWIHMIEASVLRDGIARYFAANLRVGGELVVDTVRDPDYTFNHSIEELTRGLRCSVTKLGEFERGRELYTIRKL
jgi:SAM-dependent methyltransferase